MASVVDIKAISYDVCGQVQTVSPGYKAKVTTGSFVMHIFASIYSACYLYQLQINGTEDLT